MSPLTSNEFWVHESVSLAEEVSSFCPDRFMASVNVESLFTNIPLNEDIDICIDDMRDFFNIAAYESFFIFDQVIYRQFDGVGMGSLMGPILPTAFLCHFEKH